MADDNKLKSILEAEIDDAIGYLETETTDERQQALEYYMREPYGNEVEGKSQIVTGEVAEVVDGALPQLMRVFTSADDAVVFEPVNQGDEETADQATKYVNHIFYKDNNGFEIMHEGRCCRCNRTLTHPDSIKTGIGPECAKHFG